MTDYRRPDLDLWEEEDDGEDARPTIVSERPTPAMPRVERQTLNTPGKAAGLPPPRFAMPAQASLNQASPRTTPVQDRLTPEVGRTALMQRLIAQGALEEDLAPRDSAESLRDSDLDLLRTSDSARPPRLPGRLIDLVAADREDDVEPPEPEHEDVSEAEDLIEDEHVPTVAVQRPHAVPAPMPKPIPQHPLYPSDGALKPSRDRDVTERISVESPPAGSLAPTAHTLRPTERNGHAFPWWQTALAALALVGGGLTVSQVRRMQRESTQVSAASSQRGIRAERPATPFSAALTAPTSAAPAPTDSVAADTVTAAQPVAPEPVIPLPSAVAVPAVQPRPTTQKPAAAPRKARVVVDAEQTSTERASAEAASTEQASAEEPREPAPAPGTVKPAATQDLPSQPSREDVAAALNAVVPELQKCVGDRHGTADVTLTVRSNGVVSYAVVGGMYAGTPEGSCLARAVKVAKFPAFDDPVLRVTYPFSL